MINEYLTILGIGLAIGYGLGLVYFPVKDRECQNCGEKWEGRPMCPNCKKINL